MMEMPPNDLQRSYYEAAVYKQQLNLLRREIERISLSLIDLSNAERTAEMLKKEESFVPIGGGCFVRADITAKKVTVPIGAGYMVEMESEVATRELKRRDASTRKAVERMNLEFDKVAKKLDEADRRIQDIRQKDAYTAAFSQKVDEGVKDDYI